MADTNEYVFEQATIENNLKNRDLNRHKQVKQLSSIYEERRIKLLQKILLQQHTHTLSLVYNLVKAIYGTISNHYNLLSQSETAQASLG